MISRATASSKKKTPAASKVPEQLVFIDDLEVWVRRKRVKNLSLYVKSPSARIEVSAPLRMSDARIRQFVSQKASWIRRKQAEILASPQSKAEEASDEEKRLWHDVVSSFTPTLIEKWEPVMGVKAGEIAYRNMRSRWGSCKPSTGRICINTRLALYPPECLEYVVVHELCHLLERGHGPRFYALMDRFLPDWKQRRAKLQ